MEAITIFFLLVTTFVFLYVLFNKKSNAKALNLPPGPPKLPLFGNINQMKSGLPHRDFRDLARTKYGPIMSFQMGQISAVIISSSRLAKEVLKTHDVELANRPYLIMLEIALDGAKGVVFSDYGDYWRQMRKISNLHLFTVKKIKSFGRFREEEFERFKSFIELSADYKPINIHEKVAEMVNNIISKALIGTNCKHQQELIDFMVEVGHDTGKFSIADLFPDSKFLTVLTGKKSRLMKMKNKLGKIFDCIMEDCKERNKEQNNEQCDEEVILDSLLRMKDEGGVEFPITDNIIKAVLLEMFGAGTDTTTITLEWAMTEMMRKPHVMEKAQSEVRRAFKGRITISEEELHELSYLHYVIRETLRLHPPLPLLVPHVCKDQCKIDGYDILVGQQVFINVWACGTDPEYWEDPDTFKPERFEKSSVDFMGQDYEIIPFGAGRRMCPGVNFALRTMEYFLAHMLYLYDWKLPHELTPSTIDMSELEGMTAPKKIPLQLVFKPCSHTLN